MTANQAAVVDRLRRGCLLVRDPSHEGDRRAWSALPVNDDGTLDGSNSAWSTSVNAKTALSLVNKGLVRYIGERQMRATIRDEHYTFIYEAYELVEP